MKYGKWIGTFASLLLIISCFLSWTYHADLHKNFTGFYSEQNIYGKPGKFLIFFAIASIALFLTNKLWAKRVQLFLSALFIGYAIKTFTLYASCYNAYCPEKLFGIYLMMISSLIILIASVLPGVKLEKTVPDFTA